MREHVEAVARGKLSEMPGGSGGLVGTLNIWASDLDDLPPSGGTTQGQRLVHHLSA